MKLDTSGLESAAPLVGASSGFLDGFADAPSFEVPTTNDFDGFQKEAIQMVKPAKGTTTLAFIFKEGVMVAADSRASMGGYISSQSVKKIIEINPYMLGTMAGGAADCQFWHRNLGIKCRLHELANKRRISVTGASKLLANILYSYRGMGLSVGTMIAGWDETGPGLYYVDSEGGRLKGMRFSVGSGSPYAYGVLDNGYRYDMSVEEAAELARRAIYHATFRDGASVYHVGPNGWKKLSGDDVGELHYHYYPVVQGAVEQEMVEPCLQPKAQSIGSQGNVLLLFVAGICTLVVCLTTSISRSYKNLNSVSAVLIFNQFNYIETNHTLSYNLTLDISLTNPCQKYFKLIDNQVFAYYQDQKFGLVTLIDRRTAFHQHPKNTAFFQNAVVEGLGFEEPVLPKD
ncbi:hypothetical protein GBA52_003376 [Prunus armeniaca]|nr:hypothetical protein GBA52_003376 [Prunus armeniaca]